MKTATKNIDIKFASVENESQLKEVVRERFNPIISGTEFRHVNVTDGIIEFTEGKEKLIRRLCWKYLGKFVEAVRYKGTVWHKYELDFEKVAMKPPFSGITVWCGKNTIEVVTEKGEYININYVDELSNFFDTQIGTSTWKSRYAGTEFTYAQHLCNELKSKGWN